MSIRQRWGIWRFLCHDVLQHRRSPLHASTLLRRTTTGSRHDGYWQYSSPSSSTAVDHRSVGRRAPFHHQTRPKLDNNAVKEEDGPSAANDAYQDDGRTWEQMTHIERYEHQLEELLPASLRERKSARVQKPIDPAELITVLSNAQSDPRGTVNLLSRLILVHNRPGAALFFVDQLLDYVVARNLDAVQSPPSTLSWSNGLSKDELRQPVELQRSEHHIMLRSHSLEHQYENLPNDEAPGLTEVWQFLGYLIVEASNIKSGDTTGVMSLVHQTLAKLHHCDLVPENIYDWANSPFSSTVQRSPILHLLSSRILSTLSDATWRSYQDEAITRGEKLGVSYQKTQDPPGGRFRLKVRELGPETWLEFVLWCCVESNCPQAGANILSLLIMQQSDPWCASSWKSNTEQDLGIKINWDRVKSRTGGAVGRIEGYSYDNPLAEIPPRTISVEVLLALIEAFIDAVYASDGTYSRSNATLPIAVQRFLTFLQPHRLPKGYVEYLSARSFGSMAPSVLERPQALLSLTETVSAIQALSTSGTVSSVPTSLDFDSIVQQSQLYAGLLQVSMHACSCQGEVRLAIDAFNLVQEMVDQSKMQAIASFLGPQPGSGHQEGLSVSNKDFIMSHGQLPLFRIATFLDILTDNNVTSLSEWLIYSTDVDGPLIPTSAFQRASVASALIRYAGANHDLQLLEYVMTAIHSRRLKPSVTLLRLEVNARMQCFEFRSAAACLKALRPAIAGGFHLDNLACLAVCILRLEAGRHSKGRRRTEVYLADAVALMRDLLQGRYDGNAGDFDIVQRHLFKQQIGHLLQISENLASSKLHLLASSFRKTFPSSNAPTLQPRTFNILLHGIVEVMGAAEGVRVWDQFCQLPSMERYEVTWESDAGSDSGDTLLLWDNNDDHESSLYTEHPTLSEDETFEAPDSFHGALDESGQKGESDTDTSPGPTILLESTSFQDFVSVSRPAQSKTEFADGNFAWMKEQRHYPVVIPTLRSLMIIVNKAMREASAKDGPSSAGQAQRASSLLRSSWVKDRFWAFGIEDEYRDLLRVIEDVPERATEWYPRVSTRYCPTRAAAERASAVSDLFSAIDREMEGSDAVV